MARSIVLALPRDILVLLPPFLHNIEDFMNLSSTCRTFKQCMESASSDKILRLAAAQLKVFFRPSPHFLVAATAREVGNWARLDDEIESEFANRVEEGIGALLALAIEHCGLTMQRIRELHEMRFPIINPVEDIVDKCVGAQWYTTPDY